MSVTADDGLAAKRAEGLVLDFEDAVRDHERNNSRYSKQELREQRERLITALTALERRQIRCPGCGISTTEFCERGCGHTDCPLGREIASQFADDRRSK